MERLYDRVGSYKTKDTILSSKVIVFAHNAVKKYYKNVGGVLKMVRHLCKCAHINFNNRNSVELLKMEILYLPRAR